MHTLFVVYDPRCGLCTRVKGWLLRQPKYVLLRTLELGSEEAQRRFPGLPPGELAVVSDTGQAWFGDHAFLVCLWALRDYRRWARRLASPLLLPLARQAFSAISRDRSAISDALRWSSDSELSECLKREEIPSCRRH